MTLDVTGKAVGRENGVVPNVDRPAPRLPNFDAMVLIPKALIGAAIVLAFCVMGTAPARADPNAFGALSCNCRPSVAAGSQAEEIQRGIRAGLDASLAQIPGSASAHSCDSRCDAETG
jgi:hypothetical protein